MALEIGRRELLAGALAGMALGLGRARAAAGPVFAVCRVHPSAGAGIALVDREAGTTPGPALPDRGHGVCLRPGMQEAVVFARRPGCFAVAFEPTTGLVRHRFDTPEGRHFFGHGVFDPTGRYLVATENDVEHGTGVLGLYDAADGYRRIGELPSFGIGPHDLTLLPDGKTLAVANGGILTRPETGRTPLNLDSMAPSLAYVELAGGKLVAERRLPPELNRLSIRHLAQGAGGVVAAGLQWEGEAGELVPLVALDRGDGLRLLEAPAAELAPMVGYIGSVAFDSARTLLAASCPRGNRIAFWDVAAERFLRSVEIEDGCAVGPAGRPGTFLTATGTGLVAEIAASTGEVLPMGAPLPVAYDNHLTVLG